MFSPVAPSMKDNWVTSDEQSAVLVRLMVSAADCPATKLVCDSDSEPVVAAKHAVGSVRSADAGCAATASSIAATVATTLHRQASRCPARCAAGPGWTMPNKDNLVLLIETPPSTRGGSTQFHPARPPMPAIRCRFTGTHMAD